MNAASTGTVNLGSKVEGAQFTTMHEAPDYASPCVGCLNLRRGEDQGVFLQQGFLRICLVLTQDKAMTFRGFYEDSIQGCLMRKLQ